MERFDHRLNVDSDSDDALLEELLQNSRKKKKIRARPDYLNELDDDEFRARFRLSKNSVLEVLGQINDQIEHPTDRNNSLSPLVQFLLALRFFATGNMLICVGDFCGVDKSTASRVVKRVSEAIATLRPRYVKLPQTQDEILQTQQGFYRLAAFPRVIAAIDCTHIKIRSPGGPNAEDFRCRKGFFSINVQALCGPNLAISDIVARWPGATHDQTIFNNSHVKMIMENGQFGNGILLGDSGYAVKEYLMTPIGEPDSQAKQLFNESLVRTRNTVERCFGVWKRRFPILQTGVSLHITRTLTVIVACAVLHNIAIKNGDGLPPVDYVMQQEIEAQLAEEAAIGNGDEGNGANVRDAFINYFQNRL